MPEHAFDVEMVPIDGLIPNDQNPNSGDVDAIALMIATDGWHGAVLAQKPRGRVKLPRLYAGEHRWRGLSRLMADGITIDGQHRTYEDLLTKVLLPPKGMIPVQILPLADLVAMRKMIGDNRASALASPDEVRLATLLQRLDAEDGLPGSGYERDDLGDLLAGLSGRDERGNMAEAATPTDRLGAYEAGTSRALILPFSLADYDATVAALDKIQAARELPSHSATIAAIVDEAAAALSE